MVPELIIAQDICEVQGEIYTTLQGLSGKQVTSFQANRIQERFEDFTPYLAPEQIAAGYYNISIIHRALLAEKDIYKPSENNQEKECLYKIIENTSDYKRIHYCINRLGSDYSDRGAVRAAYRRALSHTQSPSDLYKINKALAECYIDEYKPTVGFVTKQEENDPLLKAELHYKEALRYAGQSEKTSLIKKVAQLQLKQRRIDDWTETETEFAMKFLTGEERVHALIKIASINKQYTKEYLEFALKQTVSSRKIIKAKKKTIVSKIDYYLRPIYQRENNEEKIKYLNEVLQKFNSIKTYGNPLQRYIKDKTDRQ